MKYQLALLWSLILNIGFIQISAQQQVTVISRCGGYNTSTIPSIIDNDHDGMDDGLEKKLLDHFMPTLIQFDNESCPGPALDGTGDSNLMVCHIYPYPPQYTRNNDIDSVQTNPVAIVPPHGLTVGLNWYDVLIKVNCAWLYGKDCGLAGHTADVEGFNFSIKYLGTDQATGWMYDTIMNNWIGGTIQTVSHAGTLCEQVETHPYKSWQNPTGLDTVYASPDKHGNYLTISTCGASVICNPGCGGVTAVKAVRIVNLGEPGASLVPDLGVYYAAYTGNDPWANVNFLNANGGNAGTIRDKMLKPLTSDFASGSALLNYTDICNQYTFCFGNITDITTGICSGITYTFGAQQLTQSGNYTQTLTSSYGCDSIVNLHLTVADSIITTINDILCSGQTYSFNGQQLSNGGTFSASYSSTAGCDSTVILNLNLIQPSTYSFTSGFCQGSTYNFNGRQLNAAGLYSDTLINSFGCDSVIFLTLLMDSLPEVRWIGENDTIQTGNAISLNGASPVGGIYSGDGVVQNTFYSDSAGPGPHQITYTYTDSSGCSSSASKTFVVLVTGLIELSSDESISIFPNPASNTLHIICNENFSPHHAVIMNMAGETVRELLLITQHSIVNLDGLPEGFYFLKLVSDKNFCIKSFIHQ